MKRRATHTMLCHRMASLRIQPKLPSGRVLPSQARRPRIFGRDPVRWQAAIRE